MSFSSRSVLIVSQILFIQSLVLHSVVGTEPLPTLVNEEIQTGHLHWRLKRSSSPAEPPSLVESPEEADSPPVEIQKRENHVPGQPYTKKAKGRSSSKGKSKTKKGRSQSTKPKGREFNWNANIEEDNDKEDKYTNKNKDETRSKYLDPVGESSDSETNSTTSKDSKPSWKKDSEDSGKGTLFDFLDASTKANSSEKANSDSEPLVDKNGNKLVRVNVPVKQEDPGKPFTPGRPQTHVVYKDGLPYLFIGVYVPLAFSL